MTTFTAPLRDIRFVLDEVANLGAVSALPGFEDSTGELVDSILGEAGRIAEDVLAPLNRTGDRQGARWSEGRVTTPDGWGDAWKTLIDGGWNGLAFEPEWGGMGLPNTLNVAVGELWHAANMAFGLCPLLTQGAVNALRQFGSDALKAVYLPPMVSGVWTGTMNLTEPQAGSDLAAIRTRAVPMEDGSHRLFGQKIFITYGDHDLTDNIIHLVLARLPDAPEGVKGISLFLVPKRLVNPDGSLGARNDVSCVSLEHKLGIHGSPTAVLAFGEQGGAQGWLVGEPNKGLAQMFVMMNHARQSVGLQGLAIAERAYQQARAYARDRVQGVPAGWQGTSRAAIIHHPDVRRTLMGMKARIEAMRALVYSTAAAHDRRHRHPDAKTRAEAAALEELLTPVTKGWCTETGQDIASLGIQIHGGMGYIEETGAAQHLRDARITTIYEGTTAIQANDLVNRKLLRDGGAALSAYTAEVARNADAMTASDNLHLQTLGRGLADACRSLNDMARWILKQGQHPDLTAGAAGPFLDAFGLVAGGHGLGIGARAALRRLQAGETDDGFLSAKLATAAFYAHHILCRVAAHRVTVIDGTQAIMDVDVDQL
ncbi:acyl-CoA dehydrogenase family protein [Azospirillum griseum]|uniref:3-methylmercaptopropionyl-CoA dehydrogenase n=1 Tax=Azospirillum griseum TaxID=2496639 RepID=A0A3S0HWV2_9PROT|nr:acyl-CoA dehydrogenase family protein [Azospirillum griseum]RTR13029.1 acyl-CoA dehydrogenase [Azospirillum griseum]